MNSGMKKQTRIATESSKLCVCVVFGPPNSREVSREICKQKEDPN